VRAGELASGRVLVVDDEPPLLELLDLFLTGQGYGVVTVATGAADAWPLRDGRSRCSASGRRHRASDLISGHQITAREGFFGVLRKPFNLRTMAEVVAAAVAHGRTSDT
jgi:hypothetical protein